MCLAVPLKLIEIDGVDAVVSGKQKITEFFRGEGK